MKLISEEKVLWMNMHTKGSSLEVGKYIRRSIYHFKHELDTTTAYFEQIFKHLQALKHLVHTLTYNLSWTTIQETDRLNSQLGFQIVTRRL